MKEELPKIVYISDVSVELTSAGSTLIYRLLEHYPKDRLLVIQREDGIIKSRIQNVPYLIWNEKSWIKRLRSTRLHKYARILDLILRLLPLPRKLSSEINKFRPDCFLTITFRTAWIKAYRCARTKNKPLHLILHDDVLVSEDYGFMNLMYMRYFRAAYLLATSRMCISDQMERYYFKKFNVTGSVLFPSRGKNDQVHIPSDEKFAKNSNLTYCYAGSLYTSDFIPMLDILASLIKDNNGQLVIYSNVKKSDVRAHQFLSDDFVHFEEMIDPATLKEYMVDKVDVNIVLNSFENEEAFKYNFSSKVVDYAGAGIPILFWGPISSGIINWAIGINYKVIIVEKDSDRLAEMLFRLNVGSYRKEVSKFISENFNHHLSYEKNFKLFISEINKQD